MVILGSGRIVAALAREGLIDEYQLLVNPVALGKGRTMFEGIEQPAMLSLTESRAFRNGKVFLRYTSAPEPSGR
jgi:dihydrofolate reductase